MDPKRVEMLADCIREKQESNRPNRAIKKHLDAARAKLEYLQAARHKFKKDLAERTEERDEALREVERLKARQAFRPITACDVHETLIDQLQTERAFLLQALEEVVAELADDADGSINVVADMARESLNVLQRLDKAS